MSKLGRRITHKTAVLFALFFAVLIDMLGVGIIIVVTAPYIKTAPGLFAEGASVEAKNAVFLVLVGIFGIAQFFGAPLLGGLSDRYGRKKIVIGAMLGGAIGYLVFALGVVFTSLPLLFVGRLVTGFFSGSMSVVYSIVADFSAPRDKAKNFAVMGAAFGIGFIVGPVLGDFLANDNIVSWFNDSTPFFAAMGLSVISALLIFLFTPETFKITEEIITEINPLQGFRNIGKALKVKELTTILWVLFFVNLGFSFFTQYSPIYLLDALHFTRSELGWFFTFMGVALIFTQLGLVRLTTHFFSSRQILSVVVLTLSLGLLLFLLPQHLKSLVPVAIIMPMSFGLFQPNMLSIISNNASDDVQGQTLGIQQSIRSVAFTLPPLVSAYLSTKSIHLPNMVGAGIVFLAWIILLIQYKQFK